MLIYDAKAYPSFYFSGSDQASLQPCTTFLFIPKNDLSFYENLKGILFVIPWFHHSLEKIRALKCKLVWRLRAFRVQSLMLIKDLYDFENSLLVSRVRTYKLPPRAITIAMRTKKTVMLFPITRNAPSFCGTI